MPDLPIAVAAFAVAMFACGAEPMPPAPPVSRPAPATATAAVETPPPPPPVVAPAPVAPPPAVAPSRPEVPATVDVWRSAEPGAHAWADRCVVELTKGRDAAAKLIPTMANDAVYSHPIAGDEKRTIVFLNDDDFDPGATLDPAPVGRGHAKWFDLSGPEMHQKGHWFWIRDYPTGGGSITFDHGPNAKIARAIEIMKTAIDRCFADAHH